MNTTETFDAAPTASMPISMAVDSRLSPEAIALAQSVAEEDKPESKDREFFKKRIHYWWNKTLEGILETGWCLVEAQATLTPDEWSKFVKNDVPLDYSAMRKLMGVAQDHRISDSKYADLLPASWTSLHEISLMDNETFELAMAEGLIHRNVTLKELKLFRSKHQKTNPPKATAAPSVAAPSAPNENDTAQSEPEAKKAAVKAQVNNSGLRVVEEASAGTATAAATATGTAVASAKGRITVCLDKKIADQHKADLDDLMDDINALVKEYEFIGSVELEVAA